VTYAKNNLWVTGQVLYGSGLRTGEDNLDTLPAHFTLDTTVGYAFTGKEWFSRFKMSFDVINVLDNAYPITIANEFSGTQYAAGRQFFFRISKDI
jgi:outer membrane receptor for Fe3+-dicitrate